MPAHFALMLHAHMPYCRKSGVWPAGEEWLFEAMNETYIPLLLVLRRLLYAGVPCQAMVGVVPVLAEQLADPYMKDRFCEYMESLIWRTRQDLERFQDDDARQRAAAYWLGLYEEHYRAFTRDFHRDILGTLKWLQDEGLVELLTSAATHGFLPLLEHDSSIQAQVRLGVETFRRHFGRDPQGFWLPECAYRPAQWSQLLGRERQAIDQWLAREGLKYFFVEGVGITRARLLDGAAGQPGPSTFRGYRLASGVAVFGRNQATGEQVWSPQKGYPGDSRYLEFHQKDPQSGLRYLRVTGRVDKEIYDPEAARGAVADQARHFVGLLQGELAQAAQTREAPVLVAPYDCELYGHWWHEGPAFLELVYHELARQTLVEPIGLGRYLQRHGPGLATIEMTASTWGLNSDFTVWQNPEHGWLWPYINASAREMEELLAMLQAQGQPRGQRGQRILRQMGRELLLMQGSDWPFLLFTTQAKEYANQRFHHHHQRFRKLSWAARDLRDAGRLPEAELALMEDVDCPWPELDYGLFRKLD
ncbi:MAG: 1,4-alpha-glucan branching protein domain-containing protein [Pseudomonadota bacterium]